MKYLFKWSRHAFFCSKTEAQTQKIEYAYFERQEKCLHVVRNASFLLFLNFKMAEYKVGYEASSENSYL